MSPTKRTTTPQEPKATQPKTKPPKAPKPWQRAEAGTYRSSDDRFTISAEGPSRWFVTDEQERDELGLPRTIGPFATLDAAKEAADARREDAPEASPLAERLAAAAQGESAGTRTAAGSAREQASRSSTDEHDPPKEERKPPNGERPPAPQRKPPAEPPRTWLDRLEDDDPDAAMRARRLIAVLEADDFGDAENIVRRDVAGNQPAVATALLARAILEAVDRATRPAAIDALVKALPAKHRDGAAPRLAATAAVEAVLEVLGSSKARRGVPGWALVERDGPGDPRPIYVTPNDLRDATD